MTENKDDPYARIWRAIARQDKQHAVLQEKVNTHMEQVIVQLNTIAKSVTNNNNNMQACRSSLKEEINKEYFTKTETNLLLLQLRIDIENDITDALERIRKTIDSNREDQEEEFKKYQKLIWMGGGIAAFITLCATLLPILHLVGWL
jgi:hypothetical protein